MKLARVLIGDDFTQSHFWVGAFCRTSKRGLLGRQLLTFPHGVAAVTDTIRIVKDLGNNISDKSWMLYLLELFDDCRERNPIELNLICQFNERDNFWAIFAGVNRYKFTKVLPIVGHTYRRRIVMRRDKNLIEYQVTDINDGAAEQFDFQVMPNERTTLTSFRASNNFTGLEWWNKAGNSPFPIRYELEVSRLMYGQYSHLQDDGGVDKTAAADVSYKPFNGLVSNQDDYAPQYPVAFANVGFDTDGCCRYLLTPGVCKTGARLVAD